MTTLIPTLELIALFIATLAVLGAAGMYTELRSHNAQLKKLRRVLADELTTREQLEADFQALFRCSQNMGKALRKNTAEVLPVVKHVNAPSAEHGDDDRGEKVHKLLERGLSIEEVASICGLTQGEVEFLARFSVPHGTVSAAA